MKQSATPFPVSETIEPDLARVRAYWQGLRRGEGKIPFWDDLALSALPDLSGRLLAIDVFAKPERFRLGIVGAEISGRYGKEIAGRFADEIPAHHPLEYLRAQCSATVEAGAPTCHRQAAAAAPAYARLLLPLWGEGHIAGLLGATVWL